MSIPQYGHSFSLFFNFDIPSIIKPTTIPITNFIARIFKIKPIGAASDIKIGSISSDVDK